MVDKVEDNFAQKDPSAATTKLHEEAHASAPIVAADAGRAPNGDNTSKETTTAKPLKGTLENPVLGEEYYTVPGVKGPQDRIQVTKEEEQAAFGALAKQVNQIQQLARQKAEEAAKNNPDAAAGKPELHRGFHAKQVAGMIGDFTIFDDKTYRDKMTEQYGDRIKKENIDIMALHDKAKQGLFKEPTTYHILARYSNGVGVLRPDKETDVRGFAFKVLEKADGTPLPAGGSNSGSQDFLMTNREVPMGKDAYEFMDFARFNQTLPGSPIQDLLKVEGLGNTFSKDHPRVKDQIVGLAKHELRGVTSFAAENFWGGAPYRLGSDEQGSQLIKFLVKPQDTSDRYAFKRIHNPFSSTSENFLRDDLKAKSAKGDIKYDFYVQFQTDPKATPTEDALDTWTEEESMPVLIGEVTLYKGQDFDTQQKHEFVNKLSLTPWHYAPGHKPAGSINRVRESVYGHSSAYRVNGDAIKAVQDTNPRDVERVFGPFRPEKK